MYCIYCLHIDQFEICNTGITRPTFRLTFISHKLLDLFEANATPNDLMIQMDPIASQSILLPT